MEKLKESLTVSANKSWFTSLFFLLIEQPVWLPSLDISSFFFLFEKNHSISVKKKTNGMPCIQHRLQDPEIQNEIAGIVPEFGIASRYQ